MSKAKEVYKETYKKGERVVRQSLFPDRLPFTREGWRVDSIEVRAAGTMDDGREFQNVRIYVSENHATSES